MSGIKLPNFATVFDGRTSFLIEYSWLSFVYISCASLLDKNSKNLIALFLFYVGGSLIMEFILTFVFTD